MSPSGAAVDDGHYDFAFKLYDAATNGNLIWTEEHDKDDPAEQIYVRNGVYSAVLGSVAPFTGVAFNKTYYVEVIFNGATLAPRTQLTTAPYALSLVGDSNQFPNSGTVIVGDSLHVDANMKVTGNIDTDTNLEVSGKATINDGLDVTGTVEMFETPWVHNLDWDFNTWWQAGKDCIVNVRVANTLNPDQKLWLQAYVSIDNVDGNGNDICMVDIGYPVFNDGSAMSACFPVKKGYYWKVTRSSSTTGAFSQIIVTQFGK